MNGSEAPDTLGSCGSLSFKRCFAPFVMWQKRSAFLLQAGNRRFPAMTRELCSLEPRSSSYSLRSFDCSACVARVLRRTRVTRPSSSRSLAVLAHENAERSAPSSPTRSGSCRLSSTYAAGRIGFVAARAGRSTEIASNANRPTGGSTDRRPMSRPLSRAAPRMTHDRRLAADGS